MPARSMSLWLTISASAGASLSVEMKELGGFHGACCAGGRMALPQ
jgi:hypothetical protein